MRSCAEVTSCRDSSVCFLYGYGFVSLGDYCSPYRIRYAPVFYFGGDMCVNLPLYLWDKNLMLGIK